MAASTNLTKYAHPRAVVYWSSFIARSLRKRLRKSHRQVARWFRIYSIFQVAGGFTSLIQMEMSMLFGLSPMHNQAIKYAPCGRRTSFHSAVYGGVRSNNEKDINQDRTLN